MIVAMSLVPNKEEASIIFGGYYVLSNEEVMQLPENVAKSANKFLGEFFAEETVTKEGAE